MDFVLYDFTIFLMLVAANNYLKENKNYYFIMKMANTNWENEKIYVLEIAYVKSKQKQDFYFYNIKIIQFIFYCSLK